MLRQGCYPSALGETEVCLPNYTKLMSAVLMLGTSCVANLGALQAGKVDCLLHRRSKALIEGCHAKDLKSWTGTNTLESGHKMEKNTASINLQSYFDNFACGLSAVYSC